MQSFLVLKNTFYIAKGLFEIKVLWFAIVCFMVNTIYIQFIANKFVHCSYQVNLRSEHLYFLYYSRSGSVLLYFSNYFTILPILIKQ